MPLLVYSVEDDENISYVINKTLTNANHFVKSFYNGEDMLVSLKNEKPDILLLDIMLPGKSGLEIIETIRQDLKMMDLYIMIISAKTSEIDRVKGLDIGADDYLIKPFSILELSSKVNAYLRRKEIKLEILKCRDIILNLNERKCLKNNQEVILTLKEFLLLKFLLERKPNAVSKEEIIKEIWGFDFMGETRTVDAHIKTLRQKIDDKENPMIITIHSIGYRINE